MPYNGLTIVLSNQSRKDLDAGAGLLSGYAGNMIKWDCLAPVGLRLEDCEVMLLERFLVTGASPGTHAIVFCGINCLHNKELFGTEYADNTLGEQRGYPLKSCGLKFSPNVPTTVTYLPQDACDAQDYEAQFNPLLKKEQSEEDEDGEGADDKRRHGKTSRKNWKFWLARDIQKYGRRCHSPREAISRKNPNVLIMPSIEETCEELSKTNGKLTIDIETDSDFQITVLSFSFGLDCPIFTIPFFRYDYTSTYGAGLVEILRFLVRALNRNLIVGHNVIFDLLILAWRYKIPFGRAGIYDTMQAHHRCWIGKEKSLGHAMSHLTWEDFHKDDGVFMPRNETQEMKLWKYNASDVYGTMLVKNEIENYSLSHRSFLGLRASIRQANDALLPFLEMSLAGIRYNVGKRDLIVSRNDTLMDHYNTCIRHLVGDDNYLTLRGKGKSCLAASSRQAVKYFHGMLNYKVQGRSRDTHEAALGEKELWKLRLKYPENPVIRFILAYRKAAKESQMLGFTDWLGATKERKA